MYTSEWFRALGDPTRLRCFRILVAAQVPLSVAELTDILQKPQYAISRALSELKKIHILSEARQGKLVFYQIDPTYPEIQTLGQWVVHHCSCEEDCAAKNTDGSSQPGCDGCTYDQERLEWRLKLRELIPSIVTYRPTTIGGTGRPQESKKPQAGREQTKPRVLFVCVHNSARSQMAEEFLRLHGSTWFNCESAGIQPGEINPLVIQELTNWNIDITTKKTQGVSEVFQEAKTFDWIITVCDPESEKLCPVFPGPVQKLSWPFPDPTQWVGSPEELQGSIHNLAVSIEQKILDFISSQYPSIKKGHLNLSLQL